MAVDTPADTYIDSASEDDDDENIGDLVAGMIDELSKMQLVSSQWDLPINKYTEKLISAIEEFQIKVTTLKTTLEAMNPEASSGAGPVSITFMECLNQYNDLKANVEIVWNITANP